MAGVNFGVIYSRLHAEVAIAEFGPAVEEMGFAGVWVTEGLVNELPALDPLIALTAFAEHTTTIRVGTCVVLLPLRQPAILAKQVASVDLLSGGRVDFGIGVGGSSNSGAAGFQACGVALEERGPRTDEALEVMTKLWSGDEVSHDGRFHHFDRITMAPPPAQRPHPPIWTGGGGAEPVLRRTARWSDGWVPTDLTPEQYSRAWAAIESYGVQYGRDTDAIVRGVHLYLSLDDDAASARRVAARSLQERYGFEPALADDPRYAFGTPADCIELIESYAEIGVTDFVINVARPLPEVLGQVQAFHREVIPHFAGSERIYAGDPI